MSKYISYNKGQYKIGYLTNKSKGGAAVPSDNSNKKQRVDEHTGPQTQVEAPAVQHSGADSGHYTVDYHDISPQAAQMEVDSGHRQTTEAAQDSGHHAVLQKGKYTGTLQEGDIWTKKKLQTHDYTSVRKFERVFRWCHEYQGALNASFQTFNMTPLQHTFSASQTMGNAELQKDFIIANCIEPTMKWFVDDMANWCSHFYKYVRPQSLSYEIVLENRLVDPYKYLSDCCRYISTSGTITQVTSQTVRTEDLAWRWGPYGWYASASAFNYPSITTEATDIRQQMQTAPVIPQDRFMIWRDINGNMTKESVPWGAQLYDAKTYPNTGFSGLLLSEVLNSARYINRRQVEHFDSGVKIGNSIAFKRTVHVDGPHAMTGAKLRDLLTTTKSLSNWIKELEVNATPPLNFTTLPEFFHFYFVPMGDYPMYQMPNQIEQDSTWTNTRYILPFETVAHITAKADYCFFQRVGLDTALSPSPVPLPRSVQATQGDLEIMEKWDRFNRDHPREEGSSKLIVQPSDYIPIRELVNPLIPTEAMGHMYIDLQDD